MVHSAPRSAGYLVLCSRYLAVNLSSNFYRRCFVPSVLTLLEAESCAGCEVLDYPIPSNSLRRRIMSNSCTSLNIHDTQCKVDYRNSDEARLQTFHAGVAVGLVPGIFTLVRTVRADSHDSQQNCLFHPFCRFLSSSDDPHDTQGQTFALRGLDTEV